MKLALWPCRVAASCRAADDPARGSLDGPGTCCPGTDLDGCRLCPEECPGGSIAPPASPPALTALARPLRLVTGQEFGQNRHEHQEQQAHFRITHTDAIEWLLPAADHLAQCYRSAGAESQRCQGVGPAVGTPPPNAVSCGEQAKPEAARVGSIGSVEPVARNGNHYRHQHAHHNAGRPECEIADAEEGAPASVRQTMAPPPREQMACTRTVPGFHHSLSGARRQERRSTCSSIRPGTGEIV